MAWAKVHTDMLGDPKLMRGARAGLRGLELIPWLILFAKQANDDGRLSVGGSAAEPADLAPMIPGATARTIATCLQSAQTIGILALDEDGVLRFVKWKDRQSKPSATPAGWRDRKQRQRDRGRDMGVTVPPETGVTVTQTEEKRREEIPRDTCHAPPAPSWPAEVSEALSLVGPVQPGRAGKALAAFVRTNPHVQTHGLGLLRLAAAAYAKHVTGLSRDKVGYVKHPADFFARAGYWVDQVRPGGAAEVVERTA